MRKAVAALVIISALLMSTVKVAQFREVAATNPSTQWIKDIGSFSLGRGHSVIQTADGGYAITGGKDGGFLLLKTSSSGDVQWKKTYGTEAEFTSFANAIVQAEDGGYVLAGQGTPWPNFIGPNGTLFNLLKTDAAGNMQWNHSYSTEETPFLATSLIKTSDGGYAVAGYAETGHSIMSSGTGFVCLVKTDGAGNMQWKKQFEADALWALFHISVVETDDAGYALLTVADFTVNAVPVVENVDFWLIKTDSDGDMQWSKTYGGAHNDLPYAFVETADGGFLLCGETQSFGAVQADGWLVKTDSEGNMLWNKTYGGDGWDVISSVLETKDRGYVIAAMIDASSENPPSGALIFKTDTSGNTEWTVEYQGVTQPVLSPMHIIETEGGTYVFTGFKPRTDITEPMSIVLVKLTAPSTIPEDSWTTKAQMPSTRTGFGVAVVDGKIYAIGGHPYGGVTTDVNEEYDPATDKWISKKSMPGPLAWFGIAVYQNEIYVIGGAWFLSGSEKNSVWVYNPATDIWNTSKTSMPTPRAGIEANVVDGKIYVISGRNSDGVTNVTEVYDPVTDTWATKTPVPTPVYSYASAVVDDKIYVIGGLTQTANNTLQSRIDLNQIYDPKTDTWSLGTPIPNANGASAGATTSTMAPKRIYVIGGGLNQVYDPASDSWTNATPIQRTNRMENFDDVVVAVVNDQLYAIGGVFAGEDGSRYSVNDQYTPIGYIPEFPSWAPLLIALVVLVAVIVIYRRRMDKHNQRGDEQ